MAHVQAAKNLNLFFRLDKRRQADEVAAAHPRLDCLFNNAGAALGGAFCDVQAEDFDWLMDVNFFSIVRMTRAFLPMLLWPGMPGEFMGQLPVTIIFVLTASLIVIVTADSSSI